MAGDWPQLWQSVFIGLVLSFLIAKLISFVTAFKDDTHLPLSRSFPTATATVASATLHRPHNRRSSSQSEPESDMRPIDSVGDLSEVGSRVSDDLSVLAEKGSAAGGDLVLDDVAAITDDDWEGVESTELDNAFSAATAFVAVSSADKLPNKLPNEVQLQLYGLYKIATEGPCSVPAPPAFKRTARAKWNAWQKLGAMPPEDAMQKYIDIVTELFPSWATGGADKTEGGDMERHSSDSRGPMGPVFSTLVHEEESGNESKMDAIHAFAREGDIDQLLKCIESGVSVNLKDSEGRTPLHWAVDRGHLGVVELLLSKHADVDVKDNDGQTPLHYAVVCDREAIADYLVKHNADVHVKDNEDASPSSLCEKSWACMQPVNTVVE